MKSTVLIPFSNVANVRLGLGLILGLLVGLPLSHNATMLLIDMQGSEPHGHVTQHNVI